MSESFSASGSFVQTPCGPRKSGIPDSVEIPAPVNATTRCASRNQVLARSRVSVSVIGLSLNSEWVVRVFSCSPLVPVRSIQGASLGVDLIRLQSAESLAVRQRSAIIPVTRMR